MQFASELVQGRQRLRQLVIAGGAGRGGFAQGACAPVAPCRLALLGRAHVVDGALHHTPAFGANAHAQSGAHVPGQHFVAPCRRQLAAFGLAPGVGVVQAGLRRQLERRLTTDLRPGPGQQVDRQAPLPALAQLRGGDIGLVAGHTHQRHGRDLAVGARTDGCACVEVQRRVVERARRLRLQGRGRQCGGGACGARPVGFGGAAHLQPQVVGREHARFGQGGGHLMAAVVEVALCQPGVQRTGVEVGSPLLALARGQVLGEQGITGDLAVVAHAKARELTREVGPVLALAELEQPVIAQPVFDIRSAPARIEGIEFGLLHLRQPVAEFPVVDPHRQWVALRDGALAQLRQSRRVLLVQRFGGFDDHIGWRGLGRHLAGSQPQQQQRGQQAQREVAAGVSESRRHGRGQTGRALDAQVLIAGWIVRPANGSGRHCVDGPLGVAACVLGLLDQPMCK